MKNSIHRFTYPLFGYANEHNSDIEIVIDLSRIIYIDTIYQHTTEVVFSIHFEHNVTKEVRIILNDTQNLQDEAYQKLITIRDNLIKSWQLYG